MEIRAVTALGLLAPLALLIAVLPSFVSLCRNVLEHDFSYERSLLKLFIQPLFIFLFFLRFRDAFSSCQQETLHTVAQMHQPTDPRYALLAHLYHHTLFLEWHGPSSSHITAAVTQASPAILSDAPPTLPTTPPPPPHALSKPPPATPPPRSSPHTPSPSTNFSSKSSSLTSSPVSHRSSIFSKNASSTSRSSKHSTAISPLSPESIAQQKRLKERDEHRIAENKRKYDLYKKQQRYYEEEKKKALAEETKKKVKEEAQADLEAQLHANVRTVIGELKKLRSKDRNRRSSRVCVEKSGICKNKRTFKKPATREPVSNRPALHKPEFKEPAHKVHDECRKASEQANEAAELAIIESSQPLASVGVSKDSPPENVCIARDDTVTQTNASNDINDDCLLVEQTNIPQATTTKTDIQQTISADAVLPERGLNLRVLDPGKLVAVPKPAPPQASTSLKELIEKLVIISRFRSLSSITGCRQVPRRHVFDVDWISALPQYQFPSMNSAPTVIPMDVDQATTHEAALTEPAEVIDPVSLTADSEMADAVATSDSPAPHTIAVGEEQPQQNISPPLSATPVNTFSHSPTQNDNVDVDMEVHEEDTLAPHLVPSVLMHTDVEVVMNDVAPIAASSSDMEAVCDMPDVVEPVAAAVTSAPTVEQGLNCAFSSLLIGIRSNNDTAPTARQDSVPVSTNALSFVNRVSKQIKCRSTPVSSTILPSYNTSSPSTASASFMSPRSRSFSSSDHSSQNLSHHESSSQEPSSQTPPSQVSKPKPDSHRVETAEQRFVPCTSSSPKTQVSGQNENPQISSVQSSIHHSNDLLCIQYGERWVVLRFNQMLKEMEVIKTKLYRHEETPLTRETQFELVRRLNGLMHKIVEKMWNDANWVSSDEVKAVCNIKTFQRTLRTVAYCLDKLKYRDICNDVKGLTKVMKREILPKNLVLSTPLHATPLSLVNSSSTSIDKKLKDLRQVRAQLPDNRPWREARDFPVAFKRGPDSQDVDGASRRFFHFIDDSPRIQALRRGENPRTNDSVPSYKGDNDLMRVEKGLEWVRIKFVGMLKHIEKTNETLEEPGLIRAQDKVKKLRFLCGLVRKIVEKLKAEPRYLAQVLSFEDVQHLRWQLHTLGGKLYWQWKENHDGSYGPPFEAVNELQRAIFDTQASARGRSLEQL